VDTGGFETKEGGLEQSFRSTESGKIASGLIQEDRKQSCLPLVTDGDDLTIGQFVGLLKGRRLSGGLHLLFEVEGDVAKLLLDVTDDFTLGGGGERVATLSQALDQVVGQVATSKIETQDGVGESETFVDGDSVGNTITGVQDDTSSTTGGVEGEDGLDGNVEGRSVEGLEHDLSHLLSVSLGVEGSLSQEDGVLLRGYTELVVESVMPNLLHVVPVGNNTMLDRVLEGEDTSLGLGLITLSPCQSESSELREASVPDVRVLLTHSDHNTLMTGTTDN
jgi:hypothetical protein